jgi:DNA-binding MarR family transcriptional regulator
MSATPTFGAQLVGQTEKTLNAILDRRLSGTGLNEPQWVTLTLAVTMEEPIAHDQFVRRVSTALKLSETDADARITELAAAQLLVVARGRSPIVVTDAGRALHRRIRTSVLEITERLWGDLPPEDLAVAGRVLSTILDRANAELARA